MKERKCKYCGKTLSKRDRKYKDDVCSNCYRKLPLVKQLHEIGQEILKFYGGKDNG